MKEFFYKIVGAGLIYFGLWIYFTFFQTSFADKYPIAQQVEALADRPDKAVKLINQQLTQAELPLDLKVWLLNTAAEHYYQMWHFHKQLDVLQQAYKLTGSDHHKKRIVETKNLINRNQGERKLRQSYLDMRDTGMNKKLTGKVILAYVFVDDNLWSRWSNQDRLNAMSNADIATDWLQKSAKQYAINNLDFEQRFFFLSIPKRINNRNVRDEQYFAYITEQLLNYQKYPDLKTWLNYLTGGDKNSQVALIFHTNNDDRSFARTCGKGHCYFEHVQLITQYKANKLWHFQQVLPHELLHLFGAADLYNIENAKSYATTDIMNYYSSQLNYSSIEPITAWSVGWLTEAPKTPFKITTQREAYYGNHQH